MELLCMTEHQALAQIFQTQVKCFVLVYTDSDWLIIIIIHLTKAVQ